MLRSKKLDNSNIVDLFPYIIYNDSRVKEELPHYTKL